VVKNQEQAEVRWSTVKMSDVTYRQVRSLLTEIGFKEKATQGTHVLYVYPKVSARIMVPRGNESDALLPTVWLGIRRTIFENGIMGPKELDARIARLSA
jgi:predicted RNA binding protein YcfA (HicA-like mRNA interferase family)